MLLVITMFAVLALAGSMLTLSAVPRAAAEEEAQDECPWMDTSLSPDKRARLLLDASTLEQKMRWLNEHAANNPTQTTFSGGAVYPEQVPCTPVIQYTDGPTAINGAGTGITAFPVQVALSATWDADLAREKGAAHGAEAFGKGRNVMLAPGLASGRDPRSGRTSEYFGEDPALAGVLAAAHIRGIQDDNYGVQAQLKHYVANEQEISRQTSSSNVDDRTLRQIYTLPFEIAIKEGDPGSVMCAFNQVNHVYSCENATILKDILKTEIGFDGWVVTDFGARHSLDSSPPSLVAGLDQELNRPRFWTPATLNAALASGTITEDDIDEAAYRVVRAHIKHGLFDVPKPAPSAVVTTPEHQEVALRIAQQGSVLLKNDGVLPLEDKAKTIAVIGPTASSTPTAGISAASVCSHTAPGVPCSPIAPLDSISERAAETGSTVLFDSGSDLAAAAATAETADVAIVFGYNQSGEFNDLSDLSLFRNGDALIDAVAAANPNTIVVLQTGGPVLTPWVNDVKAILEVWYAGEQMGPAIASLLWGDVNPSGKLTHTFPKSEADLPTAGSPTQYPGTEFLDGIRQVEYLEGMKVGYRWYENEGIAPQFPFGHGLSYTTFGYSHLQVTPRSTDGKKEIRVHFRVTNTGDRRGREIAQVYLDLPEVADEPSKRLIGWELVDLEPGKHKNVIFRLSADDLENRRLLQYWDESTEEWTTPSGTYTVHVGGSSRDLPLERTFLVR